MSAALLTEVEASLELSVDLKYLSSKDYDSLEVKRSEIELIMFSFIKSIKNKKTLTL